MTHQVFVTVLMLARVCVSEGGWDNHDECTVVVHALIEQAAQRGIPLRSQICAYAPNSCSPHRQHRAWINHLNPDSPRPPAGWPRLPWEPYRVQFAAMVVTAYRAFLGALPSACPGALHWGARHCSSCRERMHEHGFVRARCGLRNAWYKKPARVRAHD